jgi:hypothetical protein
MLLLRHKGPGVFASKKITLTMVFAICTFVTVQKSFHYALYAVRKCDWTGGDLRHKRDDARGKIPSGGNRVPAPEGVYFAGCLHPIFSLDKFLHGSIESASEMEIVSLRKIYWIVMMNRRATPRRFYSARSFDSLSE